MGIREVDSSPLASFRLSQALGLGLSLARSQVGMTPDRKWKFGGDRRSRSSRDNGGWLPYILRGPSGKVHAVRSPRAHPSFLAPSEAKVQAPFWRKAHTHTMFPTD